MKKIFLTLTRALVMGLSVSAQDEGLFGYGPSKGSYLTRDSQEEPLFGLPSSHGLETDSEAPLGTGTVLLLGLGAAYLATKRNRKE